MQFTDYGISGIVTFQLSRLASYAVAAGKKTEADIRFVSPYERGDLCTDHAGKGEKRKRCHDGAR